jgi:hypothetical protein
MGRNIFGKLAHTPSPRQSAQVHDLLGDDSKPTNERESMRLLAEYREFIVFLACIGLVMTGYYIGKLEKGQR